MKKKAEKITITGEEYCDVLGDIIHEYYNRIVSDDDIFLQLNLQKNKSREFAVDLSIILIIMSLRIFSIKHSNDGLKGFTRTKLLEKTESTIFNFDGQERDNYEDLFDQKYNMFYTLIPKQKTSYDVRTSFVGFARYLISQYSDKQEDDNVEIIQKLSSHIVEYGEIVSKYVANSKIKTSSALAGKYEYVIKM